MGKRDSLAVGAIMVASLSLSGCSDPEWMGVYEECQTSMEAQSEKIRAADTGDSAMAKSMGQMALSLGLAACETIKSNCESDPDSSGCRAIMDSYSREQ